MKKVFLLVAFILFLPLHATGSELSEIPFGPGEKLTYKLYWTFIHAGDAVLEVMPDTMEKGVPARHFRATAKTLPWVDGFYKVRDTIDSWTNMDVTHSLRYKKDQNEGSYHKKVDLVFNKKADISVRWARGKLQHIIQQPKDALDPMAILFSFRRIPLHEGMEFGANVTDGKKTVVGEASVVKVEDVETPMGIIRAYQVNMDIKHLSGVFKKSKNAELMVWFSADERRIPVKVKSKVAVGYFTLELVKYQPSPSLIGRDP